MRECVGAAVGQVEVNTDEQAACILQYETVLTQKPDGQRIFRNGELTDRLHIPLTRHELLYDEMNRSGPVVRIIPREESVAGILATGL